ncbi:MAG: hypothetical protein JWQ98_1968 [Chlorobi bacterium]|nr:hypothetical protein [Chlorobiota bacterium]
MRMKRLSVLLGCAIGLLCASGASAQMLEKAVVSNAGGRTSDGSKAIDYTIGQPVVGRASNGTMTGDFGFWYAAAQATPLSAPFEAGAGMVAGASVAPNPISTTGSVTVTVTSRGRVDVGLYDVGGRHVANLYSGDRDAGTFTVPINAAGLASGTYYVAISAPGALVQRPVTVVR